MKRLVLLLAALLPFLSLSADVVKLKSGEVVEGTIINNTAAAVVIEVQFSPTIIDTRTIAKSDIEAVERKTPDEIAYAKIADTAAPDTALTVEPYNAPLAAYRDFLKKFPHSARAADAKAKIAKLEAETVRITENEEIKLSGEWLSRTRYVAEKYQVDAAALLANMKKKMEKDHWGEALNDFDRLQSEFANSLGYAEAIPLAEQAAKKLDQRLIFEIRNLPVKLAERQQSIDRALPEHKASIIQAIANEDTQVAAIADRAQKQNKRFYQIISIDEKGLEQMQEAARQTLGELAALDKEKYAKAARIIRTLNTELSESEAAAARTSLEAIAVVWPEYEGLARLKQRVAEVKATAEKGAPAKGDPAEDDGDNVF